MHVRNLIFLAFLLFASLAVARQCPLESDCFQRLCTNIRYGKHQKRKGDPPGDRIILEARCKNNAGEDIVTQLDLRRCIANRNGLLKWAEHGDFQCKGCRVRRETDPKKGDYMYLRCEECPRIHKGFLGMDSTMWTWLDLSYGIWVRDGLIGCFSQTGNKAEVLKVIKSRNGRERRQVGMSLKEPSPLEMIDVA